MAEWPVLKIDLKIVHMGSSQKGSKTRQNDEVGGSFFAGFSWISGKNDDFPGPKRVVLTKPVKIGQNARNH